jgi:CRP-like cAMP-binding protein
MVREKNRLPLLDVENILPILNKISILGGMTDKQLYEIFRRLETVSYRAGEKVFEQGDSPSHIYVVRSGRVKIVADVDGTPMEVAEFGVGECFGETSVIGILPHVASAHVVEDSELIVLSREAILSLYHLNKEIFGMLILNIAREACRRLHKTDKILLEYAAGKR